MVYTTHVLEEAVMSNERGESTEQTAEHQGVKTHMRRLLDATTEKEQLSAASGLRLRAMRDRENVRIDPSNLKEIGRRVPDWPVRVRREVVAALGEFDGDSVIDVLAGRIEDPDLRTQVSAVDALYGIGTERAVHSIKSLGTGSRFDQVALLASKAIHALEMEVQDAGERAIQPAVGRAVPVRRRMPLVRDRSGLRTDDQRSRVALAANAALRDIASGDVSERVREYITDALEVASR
jgi:HEAT repeat protein